MLHLALRVYLAFLSDGAASREPIGVVITLERQLGRAVFEPPLLLPGEQFIPLGWIRNEPRSQTLRSSAHRSATSRSVPPR